MCKTDSNPGEIDKVLAVDVLEFPGGFADASEYGKDGHECCYFKSCKETLLEVSEYACLPGVETGGESGESVDASERQLLAVAGVFIKVGKSSKGCRKLISGVEYVFA